MMNKIALIYMGGTLGCTGEPLSPMPAETFIPKLKRILPTELNIECFVAPVIKDSSACTAHDWLELIQMIQALQQKNYQHFVIIHGTDTLSYASALLAHFMAQSAHIVFTGSQYPLLNTAGSALRRSSDAIDNLNFALNAVVKMNTGVYLAFHHQLIHAQTALKRHTTERDAFTGLAAEKDLNKVSLPYLVTEHDIQKIRGFNCISLMLQPIDLSQQVNNIKNLLHQPPHFLILQGFGVGNMASNHELIAVLQQLQLNQCMVILTTQVPFGGIDQRYEISHWMEIAGITHSNALGHADLYAKALKMYLQYDGAEQWRKHWHD